MTDNEETVPQGAAPALEEPSNEDTVALGSTPAHDEASDEGAAVQALDEGVAAQALSETSDVGAETAAEEAMSQALQENEDATAAQQEKSLSESEEETALPPESPPASEIAAAAEENVVAAEESSEGPEEARFNIEEWVLSALEALVLASSDPLYPSRARDIIAAEMADMDGMEGKPEPTTGDMKQAFRMLQERWSNPLRPVAHGFRLVEIDGGLCVRTAAANARFIRRMQMGKPQKLSRASLETLAVIAYRQPVTKPQIEEIRGVDSSGALKALLDKKLVRILGKAEEVGRPLLYGTTKTFLEFFNLSSLNELPTLKELHELEHGISPESVPTEAEEQRAVIMDLFNPDKVSAVSAETEQESTEALDALERALGEAKDVAKRASALVFGMQVEDEDAPQKQVAPEAAPAAAAEPEAEAAPAEAAPDEVKPTE